MGRAVSWTRGSDILPRGVKEASGAATSQLPLEENLSYRGDGEERLRNGY